MLDFLKEIDKEIGFSSTIKKGEYINQKILDYSKLISMLSYLKEHRIYQDIDWYRDSNGKFLIIEIKNSTIKGIDKGIEELIFSTNGRFRIKKADNNILLQFAFKLEEN